MISGDPTAARKLQKAGREKLRRDRLNETFIELGQVLDAERPKNDKATILNDTVQLLKELTAEVSKLKAEHTALSEESRELTLEKNDLKEEKGSLKSEIERLNAQCQQRLGPSYPWVSMDRSVLSHPAPYPYPMPIPVPSAPMPMHPSMQPYPFFGGPPHGMFPNPCSTFMPYMNPNTVVEQQSTQFVSPSQPSDKGQVSAKQGRRISPDNEKEKNRNRNEGSSEVATNLELKTPGSTSDEAASSVEKNCRKSAQKEGAEAEESSSSRCSSSPSVQDSSSNSVILGDKVSD